MNRRQFLLSPLILLYDNQENKIKDRINELSSLNLEKRLNILSVKPLRENNISLIYDIYENDSIIRAGGASINYLRDKKTLDLGFDSFSFLADLYFSLFPDRKKSVEELDKRRYFLELDDNLVWINYKEDFSREGELLKNSSLYKLTRERSYSVILNDNLLISSSKVIHNPLSLTFEILNGNFINKTDLVARDRYLKNIDINYIRLDNGLISLEVNFNEPIIKDFKKIYAVLLNNIPLAGYILRKNNYIVGSLAKIKLDGKELF